jgi:hypothetical protein
MEIPFPVLSSLVVGILLSLSVPGGNRTIAIIALSILTYVYPLPILSVVLAGVGIYFWKKVYSK